ncbi:MAG: anaerobic ribonucleoside-triphosphate reductase activating protein [Candidatus Pacebacteria bacterium]|nr:anaerobic ribonucleoside-triphosphate reductase activating protein [Candidatus Paceibacterota bacterium]
MRIGGLQKTTLIDYPSEIACVVFLAGCNFRCPFCFSKELVLEDIDLFEISFEEFFSFLEKRRGQLDACVICGGEPTLNKDLADFCRRIKSYGLKIKLDTNGSNPEVIQDLVEKKLIDYVAMDVKAPFSKYKKAIAVDFDINRIKNSIEIIKNSGLDYEFRTTIVPTIHTLSDIKEIAKQIAPAKKFFIQNFRNDKEPLDINFKKVIPFSIVELEEIVEEIKPYFEICYLR